MLTTSCELSNVKLFGAVIAEPAVVHVELSSSATNASLYCCPTKYGYSSEELEVEAEAVRAGRHGDVGLEDAHVAVGVPAYVATVVARCLRTSRHGAPSRRSLS